MSARFIKRDNVNVYARVLEQHLKVSAGVPSQIDDRNVHSSRTIVLDCNVDTEAELDARLKLKVSRIFIELMAMEGMREARKPVEDLGWVTLLPSALFVRLFWPVESFDDLVSIVAAKRATTVWMSMSPIKYRSAAPYDMSISTETYQQFHEYFELMNGPRNIRKTILEPA